MLFGDKVKKHYVEVLFFVWAFLVRILFIVYIVGIETPGTTSTDTQEYDAVGLSLANGLGFTLNGVPYTIHPPGYPLFLGIIYAIYGHSYAAVKIIQAALGALTCLLVLMIGERLFTRRVGVIAAAIATVYPFLVFYTGSLLSETLFVFLSMVLLYALIRLRDNRTMSWAGFSGLVLGMMNLTRPMTLLLPGLLFFWAWIEFRSKRQAAVMAGIITVVMITVLLPWALRNYVVTGSVIPLVTTHWVTLYGANNPSIMRDPEAVGGWVDPKPMTPEAYRTAYLAFLKETLRERPLDFLTFELHKLKRFWSLFPKTRTAERDGLISLLSYGLLLPLFLVGMGLALQGPRPPWPLYAWVLYFCAITLALHGSTRYRLPVEPVIILFGAFALGWLGSRTVVAKGEDGAACT